MDSIEIPRNCSTYNPCGRHGYCRENAEGGLFCECKFWWIGDYCNEQSKSGKQVIIAGCLLGVLVIIIYSSRIYRGIQNKRKQPKTLEPKQIDSNEQLITAFTRKAKSYARVSSCICAILTVLLATGALLAKWSIIKPIHEEMVHKYRTNQSLFFEEKSMCTSLYAWHFHLVTSSVACLLVLIFSLRSKRTSLMRDQCHGYGALPMPIDFLSHLDRTFAAVVFAVCAFELIMIIVQALMGSSNNGEGILVAYLMRVAQVLVMGLRYYPYLAAVYMNTFLTLACAALYAWLDFAMDVVNQSMCQSEVYPNRAEFESDGSFVGDLFDYFGTGSTLIAIQICLETPRYVCLSYICVKLPLLLLEKLHNRHRRDLSEEERMLMKLTREERRFIHIAASDSVEMLYVRNLLNHNNERKRSQALIARILPKFIYEWRDDFRFSTRIVCVYSSIALLLYFLIVQTLTLFLSMISSLREPLQTVVKVFADVIYPLPVNYEAAPVDAVTSNFPLPPLVRPYAIAMVLTYVITIIQLTVLLVNIRRNVIQAFRGDDSEIPRRQKSRHIAYSIGNLHFAGYFIGYLVWGIFLLALFWIVICFAIEAAIVYGSVRFLEQILKAIIPPILITQFKKYLNVLLAQFVFLQHHGEVLAMNNRRCWMIYVYFSFFIDAFLGFISSIMRLVKAVIFGTIYMCRLDYSPLGRKLETMDSGFSAYCGLIHTECAHRHPVMLVFVAHLYTQIKLKQIRVSEMGTEETAREGKLSEARKKSLRYRRKWRLAVFLIHHPKIIYFRKAFLKNTHAHSSDSQKKVNEEQSFQDTIAFMLPALVAVESMDPVRYSDHMMINQRF